MNLSNNTDHRGTLYIQHRPTCHFVHVFTFWCCHFTTTKTI